MAGTLSEDGEESPGQTSDGLLRGHRFSSRLG